MSHSASKKIRKLYRETMSEEARRIGEKIGHSIRKKPRWCPLWLWIMLVKFTLGIND
jgi:hypothetical protein